MQCSWQSQHWLMDVHNSIRDMMEQRWPHTDALPLYYVQPHHTLSCYKEIEQCLITSYYVQVYVHAHVHGQYMYCSHFSVYDHTSLTMGSEITATVYTHAIQTVEILYMNTIYQSSELTTHLLYAAAIMPCWNSIIAAVQVSCQLTRLTIYMIVRITQAFIQEYMFGGEGRFKYIYKDS